MLVYEFDKIKDFPESAVILGKFDGVHKGHKSLAKKLFEVKGDLKSVAFIVVIDESSPFYTKNVNYLTETDEKIRIFEELGIDICVIFKLTKENASLSPERFIRDILVEKLHVKIIVTGPDFSFGYKGQGDVSVLKEYGEKLGFTVFTVQKLKYMGEAISSTRIRDAIKENKIDEAKKML